MKELEPSEIFKNIIIQVFWIAICVLLFKSNLFTELNLIPSTCKPRTQLVLFYTVSHPTSRNYLEYLFLLLLRPIYYGQTNRK